MRMLFLLMMVMCSAVVAAPPKEVVLLADANYPPYSQGMGEAVDGLYVQIINKAAQRMPEFSVKVVGVPWREAKQQARDGKILGIVGSYFHAHDWPYLYPYSLPLLQEQVMSFCTEQALTTKSLSSWPDSYQGLLIGHVKGYDGWLGNRVRQPRFTDIVNFIEVPDLATLVGMLARQRVDCILSEQTAFQTSWGQLKSERQQTAVQPVHSINREWVYVGYSAPALASGEFPDAQAFRRALDIALHGLHESGELVPLISSVQGEKPRMPLSP